MLRFIIHYQNQKTINKPINFEGITLHKGKYAKLKILPSSPNSGISFKRVDLTKNNIIFATSKAFATAAASLSSTLKGLKLSGSTPSGSPKTSATSVAVRLPSFIKVDVGEITPAPEGAFKVIPANVAPEDVSTV